MKRVVMTWNIGRSSRKIRQITRNRPHVCLFIYRIYDSGHCYWTWCDYSAEIHFFPGFIDEGVRGRCIQRVILGHVIDGNARGEAGDIETSISPGRLAPSLLDC